MTPLPLAGGRRLTVRWTVGGRPAPSAALRDDGLGLDTGALGLGPHCRAFVRATVVDRTDWVRDERFRQARMRASAVWLVGSF